MSTASNRTWASPRLSDQDDDLPSPSTTISTDCITSNRSQPTSKIKRLRHPTDSFLLLKLCQLIAVFVINCTLFALCFCLCLTVLPVVLFVRKLVVSCCVRINSRHGKLEAVSNRDALWLVPTLNLNTPPVSSIFFMLEGHINVEELRDFIKDKWLYYCSSIKKYRFSKLRKFSLNLCSGFAWKQIDNFNPEDLVCVSEHNGLQNNELLALEGSCHLDELNSNLESRNLWKVTVFPNFLDSDDSGVLFQMHRSISDIFPFSRLVFESLGYKTVYLKDRCFYVQRLCLYLCAAYSGPLKIIRRLFHSKAKTILNRSSTIQEVCRYKRVLWSDAIDLKCVKKVKDITRTKVNVILMSCLAGALRSYFHICGIENPDDVRTCVQIDTRPQHDKLRLNNQFSSVFVDLPSATEGAVPRLWDMRRRMDDFTTMIEGFAFYGFLRFCMILFPLSLVRRLVDYIFGKASCTLTFLSGPNTPVYFNGKMAKYMTFWNPKPNGTGISLTIATYANHVRLGAVFHQNQPCDPTLLLSEFQKEIEDLSKHLSQRTLPSHLRWRAKQQVQMPLDDRADRNANEPPV